jgi:N,N-dimethylformamidase
MLRITGYSDTYSVCPGDTITFYANSENNEAYQGDIVRLIHGDTNPEGPGFKEKLVAAPCNKKYKGKNQRIHGGSYICIQPDHRLDLASFTLQAFIFPTTPDKGKQGLISKWLGPRNSGYSMLIDDKGCLACTIGDGKGKSTTVSSGKP